jgi:hypothetical protein
MPQILSGTAILFLLLTHAQVTWAWGKRGHQIVASTAARILKDNAQLDFLNNHQFDLAYYANVPDIIWKSDKKIKDYEWSMHFLDWDETFNKKFATPLSLPVSYEAFRKKWDSDYNRQKIGALPWRVADLISRIEKLVKSPPQDFQLQLLIHMGILSHYIGDTAQPLHLTPNYDGQLTQQNGIHEYIDNHVLNDLDLTVDSEVYQALQSRWKADAKLRPHDPNLIFRELMQDSLGKVDEILRLDKKLDRKKIAEYKKAMKPLIVSRLVAGAYTTAKIWELLVKDVHNWNEKGFYDFAGKPEYIKTAF